MTTAYKKSLLKVVIIGDSGVGKTSLMNQYVNKRFLYRYKATIGVDFLTKRLLIEGRPVTLQIWDTAGQERFQQSLGVSFYRGVDCCILVYDTTCPESFANLDEWWNKFFILANCPDQMRFPLVLVGNKIDLMRHRVVSMERVRFWCRERNDIPYFETSAKDGQNVELMFETLTAAALALYNERNEALEFVDYIQLGSDCRRASANCSCSSN